MSVHWKSWILCGLVAAFCCLTAATVKADEEFGDNTPYYEDDAWYDISEWFDGNDYNPTDETIGRWDDERYDARSDTGADIDNDWSNYGNNDYDNDSYDHGNSSYGYDGRYDADNWFYDYYDDGYVYYRDVDNNGSYDYTYSYYDFDGDGLYDKYYYYHDYNGDGRYDYSTSYTFNNNGNKSNNQTQDKQQPSSAKRHSVSGQVAKTKKVSVRDTQHLLVQLQGGEQSKGAYVDLGPANKLGEFDIEKGDKITARGPVVRINNRKLLIAESIKANGSSKTIERDTNQFQGEVVGTRRTNVRNRNHLIAVVETTKNGKKCMVDLGPASRLDADIRQGTKLTVSGTPVKVQDKRIVLAHSLKVGGESFEIDRSEDKSNRSNADNQQAANSRSKNQ